MTRPLLPAVRALAAGLIALAGITCTDRPAAGPGLPFPAGLAVAPAMSSIVGGPIFDLAGVRVSLNEIPGNSLVVDTTASFSLEDSTVRLALTVRLMQPSQDFLLRIAAVDILGDTLFRAIDTVTLRQNEVASAPALALRYTGPDTLVAAIYISPRDTVLTAGASLPMRFSAIGIDQRVLNAVRVGWRSSDPASVSVAPDGTLLALKPAQGVWIVARTANDRADSTQVSVGLPATALRITPDTATIGVGALLPVSASAIDAFGITLPLPVLAAWSSDNPQIAVVSAAGIVTGLAPGSTRIVAVTGDLRDDMGITVAQSAISVATLEIDSVFVSLLPGDTLLLRATPRDAQGLPVNYPVTWTALDTIIAVDGRGMVTARSVGTGRIIATSDKASDTVAITIVDPQLGQSPPAVRLTVP